MCFGIYGPFIGEIRLSTYSKAEWINCETPNKCGPCYIHGGKSPGAPKKNKNAWKHGQRSRETIKLNKQLRTLIRESQETLREF